MPCSSKNKIVFGKKPQNIFTGVRTTVDRRLKFMLINPTAPEWRVPVGAKPRKSTQLFRYSMLSSLYVAAAMPAFVDTRIVDEDIEAVDFNTDADIIGISFMTFNAPRAYEIADRFRKERNKTVIVGGFHPSFMPDEALEYADAVCVGEAEDIAPVMIRDFLNGSLKRVYRNSTVDLQSLPVPNRNLLNRSRYAMLDAVQATRGCPQRCKFCSITQFFGHKFRARPVDEVVDELKSLSTNILFMDDNITTDVSYAKELFRQMIPLKKRWFSQCSVRIAYDDVILDLAAKSGCVGLFIGFESICEKNLKDWHKEFNKAKEFEWGIHKIHKKGIGIMGAIIFGDDGDTKEVFPHTLEFLLRSNIDVLQATILTPFPGTPLFAEMDAAGRIVDKDWGHYDFRHVVFEPKHMSRNDLKQGHDWVLRHFYSRRSITKRFIRELTYLRPSTMLRASLPLNIGYRNRLTKDGTFAGEIVH